MIKKGLIVIGALTVLGGMWIWGVYLGIEFVLEQKYRNL